MTAKVLASLGAAALLAASAGTASGHPLAPSLLEIREESAGRAVVSWKRPAQAPSAEVQPLLAEGCRVLGSPTLRADDVARVVEAPIACDGGELAGRRFGVTGLAAARADVLLRVALRDGRVVHRVLRPGEESFVVPARPHPAALCWDHVKLGVEHIAGGFDHLLFLLGLLLLAGDWRRLAGMVTAFTAGHGMTLSLAALGRISLPSAAVEALIALTIVVLACELARAPGAPPTLLQRRPWALTFGFGLLHGLGFASALGEVGLPESEVALALLGFNLGIEAGQLAFVLALALPWQLAPRLGRQRPQRAALAYAIGSVAACLLVERAAALVA